MAGRLGEIDCVRDPARARELVHPLRLSILAMAREPVSATELGSRLGLSRQRINYHVRRLAASGFLRRAGRRRRRNMIEQRYEASARGFLLSPELLGPIGIHWRQIENTSSGVYLLALASQVSADLIRFHREAEESRGPDWTLTIKSQFRFESPRQREAFDRAMREAVVSVIARHTSPNAPPGGVPESGRPFRLVLGCYPYEPEASSK